MTRGVIIRVFEGKFSNIKTWVAKMTAHVEAQGKSIIKLYFFYTTCLTCANKCGKNYVVLLAQV